QIGGFLRLVLATLDLSFQEFSQCPLRFELHIRVKNLADFRRATTFANDELIQRKRVRVGDLVEKARGELQQAGLQSGCRGEIDAELVSELLHRTFDVG